MERRLAALALRGVALHPFARAESPLSAATLVEATSSYDGTDFNTSSNGTPRLFQK